MSMNMGIHINLGWICMAGLPCHDGVPRFLDREYGEVPLKMGEEPENWRSKNRGKLGIARNSEIAYSRVTGQNAVKKCYPKMAFLGALTSRLIRWLPPIT